MIYTTRFRDVWRCDCVTLHVLANCVEMNDEIELGCPVWAAAAGLQGDESAFLPREAAPH
jgi:hypothetical protein